MAGRPVKKRTAKSYGSEVQILSRLRTAIILDRTVPSEQAKEIKELIDKLNEHLCLLIDSLPVAS